MATNKLLRSAGAVEIYDVTKAFPPFKSFSITKLPLLKEVIGFIVEKVNNHYSYGNAIHECSEELFTLWIHCNVYPVSLQTIKNRLTIILKEYRRFLQLLHFSVIY